jgi:hypothetical protein
VRELDGKAAGSLDDGLRDDLLPPVSASLDCRPAQAGDLSGVVDLSFKLR